MVLGPDTKLKDFLAAYPFMKEFLIGFNPHFKALDNPLLWKTVGRFATLSKAAVMGGAKLPDLLATLAGEIERRTGTRPGVQGEGQPAATREQTLKGIIKDLHANEDVGAAKERFRELIKDVAPWEIGKMEQTLIKEGLPEIGGQAALLGPRRGLQGVAGPEGRSRAAGRPPGAHPDAREPRGRADRRPSSRRSPTRRPRPRAPRSCSRASPGSTFTTCARRTSSSRCSRSRASRGRARSCGRSTTTSASCSRTPAPPSRTARSPRIA